MTPGRVLVVAPHATRTGSTQVLMNLLEGVLAPLGLPLAIDVGVGGPLAPSISRFGGPLHPGEVPRLVVVNGSLAADSLCRLPGDPRSLVYVHEPPEVLARLPEETVAGLRRASTVLCVTDEVAAAVAAITSARIVVIPPPVAVGEPPSESDVAHARQQVGAEVDQPLLIGCGEAGWRKGADLFVEVVKLVSAQRPVRAAWIGRQIHSFGRRVESDTRRAGLEGRIVWVGEVADAAPYLAAASVLVMPSRYDPMPLVVLEASYASTPTVAFSVGGLSRFAKAGAALAVDYPDAVAMAAAIGDLLDDAALARSTVEAGRNWHAKNQALGEVLPRIRNEIIDLLEEG